MGIKLLSWVGGTPTQNINSAFFAKAVHGGFSVVNADLFKKEKIHRRGLK
jgi:hypothetical protein